MEKLPTSENSCFQGQALVQISAHGFSSAVQKTAANKKRPAVVTGENRGRRLWFLLVFKQG
jgi:hypothetical protein